MKRNNIFLFCVLAFSIISFILPVRMSAEENFAVADFSGKNVSHTDASIVADMIRTELVNIGQFNVVEKANMEKILAEAAFQQPVLLKALS